MGRVKKRQTSKQARMVDTFLNAARATRVTIDEDHTACAGTCGTVACTNEKERQAENARASNRVPPVHEGVKKYRKSKIEILADDIKDEIDRLHEIRDRKQRRDAAQDLIDYIQLHHIEYPS